MNSYKPRGRDSPSAFMRAEEVKTHDTSIRRAREPEGRPEPT